MTPVIAASTALGTVATTNEWPCVGTIAQNKLFQLAGSPKEHATALSTLESLVGSPIDEPDDTNSQLLITKKASNGVTCFELSRCGFNKGGTVAILVFNRNKEIIRW